MSCVGALALAVSVFLPWYRVSTVGHAPLRALPGHSLTILGYHQALPVMKTALLLLAGLALLDAVLPLLRLAPTVPGGAGSGVALIGSVAAAFALYRILVPPAVAGELVSLREGPWLALLASLTVILGGLWPRQAGVFAVSEAPVAGAWIVSG
jgi:hypothetical protein